MNLQTAPQAERADFLVGLDDNQAVRIPALGRPVFRDPSGGLLASGSRVESLWPIGNNHRIRAMLKSCSDATGIGAANSGTAAIDAVVDTANRYGLTVIWMIHEVLTVGGSDGIGVDVETNTAMHRYLVERIARDRNAGLCAIPTIGQLGRELYENRLVASRLLP